MMVMFFCWFGNAFVRMLSPIAKTFQFSVIEQYLNPQHFQHFLLSRKNKCLHILCSFTEECCTTRYEFHKNCAALINGIFRSVSWRVKAKVVGAPTDVMTKRIPVVWCHVPVWEEWAGCDECKALGEQMRGSVQVIRVVNYPESLGEEHSPAQRLQSTSVYIHAHNT